MNTAGWSCGVAAGAKPWARLTPVPRREGLPDIVVL